MANLSVISKLGIVVDKTNAKMSSRPSIPQKTYSEYTKSFVQKNPIKFNKPFLGKFLNTIKTIFK